ncbi:MAG: hypothetical protein ACREET_07630 [Stellaceae bacterium]
MAHEAKLQRALHDFGQRMTIEMGSMLIVAVGIILAALRFMPVAHP